MNTDIENLDEEELKAQLQKYYKILEQNSQEIYELKRKVQQKESLENDLKIEHEVNLCDIASKDKEIKELKERLRNVANTPVDTSDKDNLIEQLQEQLASAKEELKTAEKEIEAARAANHNETLDNDLSLARHELSGFEVVHQEKCSQYEDQIKTLNAELSDKVQTLCHLETTNQNLRMEMQSLKEEIEQKEEDAVFMQNELMLLRQPAIEMEPETNKDRGNSLFSEVEDNRIKAIAALKNTKSSAEQAFRDLATAKSEIQALKVENFSLHRKWDDLVATNMMLAKSEDSLLSKLRERVEALTKELDMAEVKILNSVENTIPKSLDNHQWIKFVMQNQKKKENELLSKIRNLEMNMLLSEESQIQLKKKFNLQVAEITALKGELGKVKLDLENRGSQGNESASLPSASVPGVGANYMTPSRADAISKLMSTIASKNKGLNVQFTGDTKQEDSSNKLKQTAPSKVPRTVIKTTSIITTKKE